MDKESIVDGLLLSSGVSPRDLLLAHFSYLERTAKTAAIGNEYRIARLRLAKMPMFFFYDLAKSAGASLLDLLKLFKNSKVVAFFAKIGWSFKKLYDLLRMGYKVWVDLQRAVADYISNSKVGRWTNEELKKLDKWLVKHPKLMRYGGLAVAGLLVYLWFNASYTGDVKFDFDVSDILAALSGSYSLATIFGGTDGMRFLVAIVAGFATTASFPWPGPTHVQFVFSILAALGKKFGIHLRRVNIQQIDKEAIKEGIL